MVFQTIIFLKRIQFLELKIFNIFYWHWQPYLIMSNFQCNWTKRLIAISSLMNIKIMSFLVLERVDSRFVETLIDFPVSSKNLTHCFFHHSRFVENEKTTVPFRRKIKFEWKEHNQSNKLNIYDWLALLSPKETRWDPYAINLKFCKSLYKYRANGTKSFPCYIHYYIRWISWKSHAINRNKKILILSFLRVYFLLIISYLCILICSVLNFFS